MDTEIWFRKENSDQDYFLVGQLSEQDALAVVCALCEEFPDVEWWTE